MLNLKALLTKILQSIIITEPSISITMSTGTLVSSHVVKMGKLVFLNFNVRNSSGSVASGGNVCVGTVNTTALRPRYQVIGSTFYGAASLGVSISQTGTLTVRNASSIAVTISGANSAACSLVYFVA